MWANKYIVGNCRLLRSIISRSCLWLWLRKRYATLPAKRREILPLSL